MFFILNVVLVVAVNVAICVPATNPTPNLFLFFFFFFFFFTVIGQLIKQWPASRACISFLKKRRPILNF